VVASAIFIFLKNRFAIKSIKIDLEAKSTLVCSINNRALPGSLKSQFTQAIPSCFKGTA
jgi:hypothetical protein